MFRKIFKMLFRSHPNAGLPLTCIELEMLHKPLAQVAPASLREDGALGPEGHPTLKTIFRATILHYLTIIYYLPIHTQGKFKRGKVMIL